MQRFVTQVIVGAAIVGLCSGSGMAVQQSAPAKKVFVKAGPHGVVFYKSKPVAPLTGSPLAFGATFNIQLTPGGSQCFQLPSGANWDIIGTPMNTRGYRYSDSLTGIDAIIKEAASGKLLLKFRAKGATLTVGPGNPTLAYALNLSVKGIGGDEYCATTGTATPGPNSETKFIVRQDDNGACTLAACSPSGAFLEDSRSLF